MQKKIDTHVFNSLKFDFSPIKQPAECLVDAHNIRFETKDGESLLSISPERGTKKLKGSPIEGDICGKCIVGNYLILFTTNRVMSEEASTSSSLTYNVSDYIYRITLNEDEYTTDILYQGYGIEKGIIKNNTYIVTETSEVKDKPGILGFKASNTIQAIPYIETALIQKVYWVDGINSPRYLNVVEDKLRKTSINVLRKTKTARSFDFTTPLQLKEEVTVEKELLAGGIFPAGTLQYAFSYYFKYGNETPLAWVSPIYYTTLPDRSGSPEDTMNCRFKINVSNVDTNYDYLRLYSIVKTSYDGTPIVKRVKDIPLKEDTKTKSIPRILYIDNDKVGAYPIVSRLAGAVDGSTVESAGNKETYLCLFRYTKGNETCDYFMRVSIEKQGSFSVFYARLAEEPYYDFIPIEGTPFYKYTGSMLSSYYIYEVLPDMKINDDEWVPTFNMRTGELSLRYSGIISITPQEDEDKKNSDVQFYNLELDSDTTAAAISEENLENTNSSPKQRSFRSVSNNNTYYCGKNYFVRGWDTDLLDVPSLYALYEKSTDEEIYKTSDEFIGYGYSFRERNIDIFERGYINNKTCKLKRGGSNKPADFYSGDDYFKLSSIKGVNDYTYKSFSFDNTVFKTVAKDGKVKYFRFREVRYDESGVGAGNAYEEIATKDIFFPGITNNFNTAEATHSSFPILKSKSTILPENESPIVTNACIVTIDGEDIILGCRVIGSYYELAKIGDNTIIGGALTNLFEKQYNETIKANVLVYKGDLQVTYNVYDFAKVNPSTISQSAPISKIRLYPNNISTEGVTAEDSVPILYLEEYEEKEIEITSTITIYDANDSGEIVDPQSLLYLGGEDIIAGAIANKEDVLFLGNISTKRPSVNTIPLVVNDITDHPVSISTSHKANTLPNINTLNLADENGNCRSPLTFKARETYRLGLQFQYLDGTWSEPVYYNDTTIEDINNIEYFPLVNGGGTIDITTTKLISKVDLSNFKKAGFKRVRPLIVKPSLSNMSIIAQGFLNPNIEYQGNIYSSWAVRPILWRDRKGEDIILSSSNFPTYEKVVDKLVSYNRGGTASHPIEFRHDKTLKIQELRSSESFKVNSQYLDFYSPDLEFNESLTNSYLGGLLLNYQGKFGIDVGYVASKIVASTSPKSNSSKGESGSFGRMDLDPMYRGPFYADGIQDEPDDKILDDNGVIIGTVNYQVYAWQPSGSMCAAPQKEGEEIPGKLKTKVFQNSKYSLSTFKGTSGASITTQGAIKDIELHRSNDLNILTFDTVSYFGNVNLALITAGYSAYMPDYSMSNMRNWSVVRSSGSATCIDEETGKSITQLTGLDSSNIEAARIIKMKYKTAPHAIIQLTTPLEFSKNSNFKYPNLEFNKDYLLRAELVRPLNCKPENRGNMLYGNINETMEDHLWIPSNVSIAIDDKLTTITWLYGDTFFQQYECLKTSPFTFEDENQVVDIFSCFCETRVNLDGRYDKNKSRKDNFYANTSNFNLLNSSYSNLDTYFNTRKLDEDYYKVSKYGNMVCWTLSKQAMNKVDDWCSVNLASSITVNTGDINSINLVNNDLFLFQDTYISQLLYNSRVQLQTSENVPIEIANSGKVEGTRNINNNIGCSNFNRLYNSASGVYFIDTTTSQLYHLGDGGVLQNVSKSNNVSSWFSNNEVTNLWYNPIYQDLYIRTDNEVLKYSESMGRFTSFLDYQEAISLFNIKGNFIGLYKDKNLSLWGMCEEDNYNNFFGTQYGSKLSFISNSDSPQNKIFSNVEFRADTYNNKNEYIHNEFPFDYIRAVTEYQDTSTTLLNTSYSKSGIEYKQNSYSSNIRKKFRTWRTDIPRDKTTRRDRISDFWTKITLSQRNNKKYFNFKLHDLNVIYYV